MKWWIGLLIVATTATAAAGQTTRPAPAPPWPETVQRFAQALVSDKATAAAAECDPNAILRPFHAEAKGIERLLTTVAGGKLLGAHAYFYPPLAMGADVAADFKNARIVPDDIKQNMIPADDDGMKRANATAVQWVAEMLQAQQDDPIGVIVFWRPHQDSDSLLGAAAPPQVVFILLKGAPFGKDQFHIVQAEYGNPLAPGN
jgi:hypothetical protein